MNHSQDESITVKVEPAKRSWFWSVTRSCHLAFVMFVACVFAFLIRIARGDFESNWTQTYYGLSLFWALIFITRLLDEIRGSKK